MKVPNTSVVITAVSAIVAGGVFAFGLPWFVLPVVLATFFWNTGQTQRTFKHSLLLTSLFFWLFYVVVLSWFLDTDISLLAGLASKSGLLILGFSLFTMTTVLTVASIPFGLVVYFMQSRLKKPSFLTLALVSMSWLLIEWLRSIAFSLFLYAPNASIGDYWNFGSLGLGLISTPLGYTSRLAGMYGLSMLVIALGIALYWASQKHFRPLVIVVFVATFGSLLSYKLMPISASQPVEARLLQGDAKFSGQATSLPLRNKSDTLKDLIVLPEYSRVYDAENTHFTEKFITSQLSHSGVVLDVTADFTNPGPRKSYLVAHDKTRVIDTQTKRLLIPTGEYLPSIVTSFYSLTGQSHITEDFTHTRKLEKGESPQLVTTQKLNIAPVACSGILGRNIYRQLVNDGGTVLTNSASLATFGGSKSYFRQSLQMAKFHAIANNRAFIQATIGAPGFVIDNNGRYTLAPDGSATEFADFMVTPHIHKTIYTKYGDWPLLLSAIFMAGSITIAAIKRLRKSLK